MATLSNNNGRPYVQWPDPVTGKLQTLRLGKLGRKSAELVRSHIDHLLAAKVSGQAPPLRTVEWLNDVGLPLHAKLVRLGLVRPRAAPPEASAVELAAFIDGYIERRTDLKPNTIDNLRLARTSLVRHFGRLTDLRNINRGEAGDWQRKELKRYAPATVAMLVKKAKQFFEDAVDRRLVTENPFAKLKIGSMSNDARQAYVSPETMESVFAMCPDAEWRALFALARFGGLRTPSECRLLQWQHVDWERKRMVVHSPKTEHHPNGAVRVVPIYQQLEPYLRAAFDQAAEGAVYVIQTHRGENIRTQAKRIVARAGLTHWPKIFQNLRSSCQTDLADRLPEHVVCQFMGNSERVARKHYLLVTEEHFAQALGQGENERPPTDEEVDRLVKALRQALRSGPLMSDQPPEGPSKTREFRGIEGSKRSRQGSNL